MSGFLPSVVIGRIDKQDLPEIPALQKRAYRSEAELVGSDDIPPLQQSLADLTREHETGAVLKAVAPDGRIIGSVRAHQQEHTCYVGKLIVDPVFQGRGLGTRLLMELETVCPASRYVLFTSDKSIRNIRLYERLGYRRFREDDDPSGVRFVYLEKVQADDTMSA